MKTFNYVITDELGIHARPAGLLVKEAKKFESSIKITVGEKTVDAKGIMGVMQLAAKQGDEITLSVEGADEDATMASIEAFLKNNL